MRGVILGVHEGRGIITSEDQRRLEFPLGEWRSGSEPLVGDAVDFMESDGEARAVFRVPGTHAVTPPIEKSSTLLGLIAVGCLALGFLIPLFPTVAALIVGLIGDAQAKREKDETGLLLSRIGWIGAVVMLVAGFLFVMLFGAFIFHLFAAWLGAMGWNVHWGAGTIFWSGF